MRSAQSVIPPGQAISMPADAFLAVLAAAILHAGWNAMAKGRNGSDPLAASVAIAAGAAAVALPALILTGLPGRASAWFIAASVLLHVIYFTLVGLAYRAAHYSVAYPLTRGTAPLGTAILGAALLGENLRPLAWLGVALLSAGVVALGSEGLIRKGLDRRGLAVAGLNIGIIIAYTLVDGTGARASGNAPGYVTLMMLLTGLTLVPAAYLLRGADLMAAVWSRYRLGLLGGAMVLVSYGTALWAMTRAPIALVGALRETSVLFATVFAAFLLGERLGGVRWVSTVAIAVGLIAIRLA